MRVGPFWDKKGSGLEEIQNTLDDHTDEIQEFRSATGLCYFFQGNSGNFTLPKISEVY